MSFFDTNIGYAVGAGGVILGTTDGGKTWKDQESPTRSNLFAIQAFGKDGAVAVGELGTVLVTEDAGRSWQIQPNITGKVLQAVVYRGGKNVWAAGRGGTILKRTEPLSPKPLSGPKTPPTLTGAAPRLRPKYRQPLVTITDDGDIPAAVPIKKP